MPGRSYSFKLSPLKYNFYPYLPPLCTYRRWCEYTWMKEIAVKNSLIDVIDDRNLFSFFFNQVNHRFQVITYITCEQKFEIILKKRSNFKNRKSHEQKMLQRRRTRSTKPPAILMRWSTFGQSAVQTQSIPDLIDITRGGYRYVYTSDMFCWFLNRQTQIFAWGWDTDIAILERLEV